MTEKLECPISGGCMCGEISYVCTTTPSFSLICQCRQCQRITGTGHSAQFAVPGESTTIVGQVQFFQLTSDAGNDVKSAFCGRCGNPVYKTTSMAPELIVFHAATLDDPTGFKPDMVVHSESCQPWDHVDPVLSRQQ